MRKKIILPIDVLKNPNYTILKEVLIMTKKNKVLVITSIILAVLVAVMGCYIVYDTFIGEEYTYDDLEGLYKYIGETVTTDDGNEYNAYFYLYLYKNGTFKYTMGTGAPHGYMGNYIIKGNTIVLNYLFSTNSGAAITVTTGSKTITIADKDTVVDADWAFTVNNMTTVTLKKASLAEGSDFLKYEDFTYWLKNFHIFNDAPEME